MSTISEDTLHKIPLRITDTTLRDAHQSLWATRMRTDDMLRILDVIDNVGYYSLECWGGATFDVCLRFLRENPWERLRLIKSKAKNTPLQMLLRGQNLVGYRNYADDVVDRFVALACENGIDIFRVFDALNDSRNLEAAIKAVKKHGGHAQGTLCYTISKVHTVEKYISYAREQVELGIDSLCIKDMAGILSPISAERLVTGLIKEFDIPIQLHCHASSGMAIATYVEGVRSGAGAIDCAISSMSGSSSQPPVETMSAIFTETNYSAGLDVEALDRVARYFNELSPHRQQDSGSVSFIDPGILVHQIPGGMISNFKSQLSMQKALDKLPVVLDEVSRVREDLGFPPLVTPTSQIVGTQAVMNVLAGEKYKIVPNEVKDYVRGKYGRSPVPIKKDFLKKILGDEEPIDHRPADELSPMLPNGADSVDPKYIEHEEDIISYILLPEPALQFFQWRALPPEQRPETPADIEIKKMRAELEKEASPVESGAETDASPKPASSISLPMNIPDVAREVLDKIEGLTIEELVFKKGNSTIAIRPSGIIASPFFGMSDAAAETPQSETLPAEKGEGGEAPAEKSAESGSAPYSATIDAPFVGTFYLAPGPGKANFIKEGDEVEAGDRICIVEAMKLFNEITAPKKCRIVQIIAADGQAVEKGQSLIGIEEL
ncbi:MAG: pyruvate carboxylase subunit B [Acidobacteria bacterium]|nr:pyruvate carboxylase subunit B [Acidobacteriota bacterium]